MADLLSVKEFAQALTLLCAPEIGLTEEMKIVYECLVCPSYMIEIVPIVRTFSSAFFDPITDYLEYYAELYMESEERFLKFMIPRCLILCDSPKPFFFILSCSFVVEIIYQMFDKLGCYRFVVTASKCIRAIIERKFKFFFEDEIQWQSLSSYCENVMDKFYAEEEETCIFNFILSKGKLKAYISNLIDKCNAVMDSEFVLSAYELALLGEEDAIEIKSEINEQPIRANESFNELPEKNDSVLDSVRNDKGLNIESKQLLSEQSSSLIDGVLDLSRKKAPVNINKESILESTNDESCLTQNLVSIPNMNAESLNNEIINITEAVTVNDSQKGFVEIPKTISEPSFEEKYAGCVFENDVEYRKKVKYAESLEQDPGRFLQGPCFTNLHNSVCKSCNLKCFKFLVLCVERHRNMYGDDRTIADAYLELYSDE